MFTDIYNTYDESSIDYYYPYTFDSQNRVYLEKHNKPIAVFQSGFDMNFSFPLRIYLMVAEDDIITTTATQEPEGCEGRLYQKFYNITDVKSWTCTNAETANYIWTANAVFQDESGNKPVLMPVNYLTGKDLIIKFYDFRYGEIYTKEMSASNLVEFTIDADESFGKGVYQMSVDLVENKGLTTETIKRIIKPENCCIIVEG